MNIKIFFCFSFFSLLTIASDQQLDQIINLLQYEDNTNSDSVSYYTMSDFLEQNSKTTPFIQHYFRGNPLFQNGNSYSNFMGYLYKRYGFYSPEEFFTLTFEQQQRTFFDFYQYQTVNYLVSDFYNSLVSDTGTGYLNPLMLSTLALSQVATSIYSSSSGGSGGFDYTSILDSLNLKLDGLNNQIQRVNTGLDRQYKNFTTLPLLNGKDFKDFVNRNIFNQQLFSTNKSAALALAIKDAALSKIDQGFGDSSFFYSNDILNSLNVVNSITSGIIGGGQSDDPSFKRSVTNSLSNISTNSNLIVETLNKILEQVAKTQTNNQQIADSVYWMTNNFPDEVGGVLPPGSSNGGSNDVWHVWDVFASSSRNEIKAPKIIWDEIEVDGERVLFPRYEDLKFQPSDDYNRYWSEYQNLLSEARAGNISGQEFLTGIQIFSMRFLGDISSQLMILSNQLPTKTNLWQEINHFVDDIIPQEINNLESEIQSQRSNIEQLNKSESVYGIIPAVKQIQTKIELLKQHSGNSILRLPVPAVMRSKVDYWEVDPNSINGSAQLRTFFIWVCSVIYTIIFVRTFIVPILILVCLGIRLMDHSLGLLFFDDTKACKVVGNWTSAAFDLFCHLIGLDTNFKKWAVGIDVNED